MKKNTCKVNASVSRGNEMCRVNTSVSYWLYAARFFAGCFYFYGKPRSEAA